MKELERNAPFVFPSTTTSTASSSSSSSSPSRDGFSFYPVERIRVHVQAETRIFYFIIDSARHFMISLANEVFITDGEIGI